MKLAIAGIASAILAIGLVGGGMGSWTASPVHAAGLCSGYFRIALTSGETVTESDTAATDCANVTGVTYDIHLPAQAATGFETELGLWQVTVDIDYYYDMPAGRFYTVTTIQTSDGNDPATYTLSSVTSSGSRMRTVNATANIVVRNKV